MTDTTPALRVRTARRNGTAKIGISLLMRRVWYADDDNTPPATPPEQNTNSEAKFTQADIDRILAERLSRAKESTRKELLGEFGVDNPDTLKEALKKAKEREEAEMSESQKLQKQLEVAQKANALLSEEKQNLLNAQRIERRNSAIIAAAQEAKAIDPSDVVAWATGQGELIDAALKEDDTTDTAAIKKLIDAAKKAKPHFFTSGGVGSPSNSGGRVPGTKLDNDARAENFKRMRRGV